MNNCLFGDAAEKHLNDILGAVDNASIEGDMLRGSPTKYPRYGADKGVYCVGSKSRPRFVAFDNSTGDCWVEEFDNYHSALVWLSGCDVDEATAPPAPERTDATGTYAHGVVKSVMTATPETKQPLVMRELPQDFEMKRHIAYAGTNREYELFHNALGEPVIQDAKTGKVYTLSWQTMLTHLASIQK